MTIEITGTGGIIEGNLGAANVNVNLDPIYGNFDGDDSSSLSNDTDFDNIWATNGGCVSAWIYPKSDGENNFGFIASKVWNIHVREESSGFVKLQFGSQHTGTQGEWKTNSAVIPINAWSHIAIVYDSDSTSHDPVIYLNGISTPITEGATPATYAADDATDLYIGNNPAGNRTFDGYIMDVKIYRNVAVSATHVAKMASKINVDKSAPDMPSGIRLWWKGTASTGTDSSGEGNNLTASNLGSVVYDAFSVDVYDGYDGSDATTRTTTDGTFTVTQGKVEGKALTSLCFDGANDNVNCASPSTLDNVMDGGGSFAAWIRADSDGEGNDGRILDKGKIIWNVESEVSSSMKLRLYQYFDGNDGSWSTTDRHININQWHHVAVTYDNGSTSNDPIIYIDGVLRPVTEAATPTGTRDSDASENLYIGNQGALAKTFDGDIKDVKVFQDILSAEQIASLYSNTYPQTPNHYWKLDDSIQGVDTLVAVDSGTETAANGGLDSFVNDAGTAGGGGGSGWQNGTLDLDGTLTIAANGTLSAPRGTLQLSDDFTIAADTSTFTHNNGTVEILGNVELFPADYDSSENERHIFYNIAHTSHTLYIERPTIIENQYTKSGGTARQYTKTTFGTATSAGTMTINSGTWDFYGYYGSPTLQGANQLYPLVVTGSGYASNGPIDWDTVNNEARSPDTFNYIKWIDFQKDMVTGGNGGDAVMLGDCEFDAFTISSGDSLDLNGQRAEFSGVLQNSGAIKSTGGGLIIADDNIKHSGSMEGLHDGDVNVIVNGGTAHDWRLGAADGAAPWCRHLLTNGTVQVTDDVGRTDGTQYYNPESIIVGSGTLTNTTDKHYVKDMTIATGGTFTPSHANVVVGLAGDFTTSGGLIGKSAGEFVTDDGTTNHNYITAGSSANSDGWTNLTVETWVKMDHLGHQSSEATFFSRGANSNPKFGLQSGKLRLYSPYGNLLGNTAITTGKWFHVACSYNSSGVAKLYIDGKLDAQATIADNILSATSDVGASMIGAQSAGSKAMDGVMGKISIWNHELTQDEIRKLMFMTGAEMQADNTNFPDATANDCKFFYNFDEGTGSTIADSGPGGNNGTWAHNNSGTAAVWAGAGTFTYGTSTLVMAKSGTQTLNYRHVEEIYNLTINDGSTTQIQSIGDANGLLDINNNLTVNEKLKSHADSAQARIRIASAAKTITIGSDVKTTALSELYSMEIEHSGSTNVPELTTPRLLLDNTATAVATGNLTITEELDLKTGTTFNANGNTIAAKLVDVNGGTLDLSNSTMNFSVTSSGDDLSLSTSSTLLTGNTTLSGHSSATPTPTTMGSAGNFEVVGNVSNLALQGGGDLTVIGSVTNCTLADSTANIRQWHHTLDTQQLLDADEAGDDDLRLTKPALDNALELMTK